MTISGDAKFGIDYNSDPTDENGDSDDNKSKHSFTHEMGVDFTGSGTTDGGLTFGGKAGFDTGAEKTNTGTVFVSGSFGTITFGGNDPADFLAGGIADVGLNGVGVDDVVEDIRGTTASQFRYDHSVGNISLAISAGTGEAIERGTIKPAAKKSDYATGMSFSASGAKVGLGYDSKKTISAGFGYSTGQISANAFYAKKDVTLDHLGADEDIDADDGMFDAGYTGIGLDVSYTMGASTLTLVYAKTDLSNIQPIGINSATVLSLTNASIKGLGVGFSHDLGGGAKLVAGFGRVPTIEVGKLDGKQLGFQNQADGDGDGSIGEPEDRPMFKDKNMASVGLSFSF